jgi:four helix bundle protein
MVTSYRDLLVWQKGIELVIACYRVAESFPKTELFGLCSQLKRAIVSVPANIAEGHGRRSTKEFLHHLSIAYGSLMEVETHLQIALQLGFIDVQTLNSHLERSQEVGRMLNGLMRSLRRKMEKGRT